jgi:hypothetical protein
VAEQAAAVERRRQREQQVTDEGDAGTVVETPAEKTDPAPAESETDSAPAAAGEETASEAGASMEDAVPPTAPTEGPGPGVDD